MQISLEAIASIKLKPHLVEAQASWAIASNIRRVFGHCGLLIYIYIYSNRARPQYSMSSNELYCQL